MRLLRKILWRGLIAVVGLLLIAWVAAAVSPQVRTAARAAGLVFQVLPDAPIKPLAWFTDDPIRTAITYPTGAIGTATAQADIYRLPDDRQRAAVVLFLGVNPAGRDDERVVNLAEGLARAGFEVLVPWSQNMISKRVDATDVEMLVAAFQHLRTRPGVDPDRIGAGGFCVGSSLLTVAASDPRVRDDVAFLNFFSGYYDSRDFLAQYAARTSFEDGVEERWEPDSLTHEVWRLLLIDSLPDPAERDALTQHFAGTRPLTSVTGLSEDAATVHALLSGASLDEARRLVARLPAATLSALDALSPSRAIDGLRAELLVMHDREDQLVPVEESRRLVAAAQARGGAHYTEFSFFQHVDPGKRVGFWQTLSESAKLFRHLYSVVRRSA